MPGDRIPTDKNKISKIVKALTTPEGEEGHDANVAYTLANIKIIPSKKIPESEIDKKEKEGEKNEIKEMVNGVVGYQMYVKRHGQANKKNYEDFYEVPKDDMELRAMIRQVRADPVVKVLVMNGSIEDCRELLKMGLKLEGSIDFPKRTSQRIFARRLKKEIEKLSKTVVPGGSEINEELKDLLIEMNKLKQYGFTPISLKEIQDLIVIAANRIVWSVEKEDIENK